MFWVSGYIAQFAAWLYATYLVHAGSSHHPHFTRSLNHAFVVAFRDSPVTQLLALGLGSISVWNAAIAGTRGPASADELLTKAGFEKGSRYTWKPSL